MPLRVDDVRERLRFARRRVEDLLALNHGDLLGADAHERQMLIQEVFFHLVGAIEVFAQLVNERRALNRPSEVVRISRIADWLPQGDRLITPIKALYVNPRGKSLSANPYTDDCLMLRVWNYRHQVTHRSRNPLRASLILNPRVRLTSPERLTAVFQSFMNRGDPPTQRFAHFALDPRDAQSPASDETIENELHAMCDLVERRLTAAIQAL